MKSFCQVHKFDRYLFRVLLALFISAMVIGSAGCAKLKSENSAANTAGGETKTTPASSTSAPPAAAGTPTTWQANANSLIESGAQTMTVTCSPAGQPHNVWGSDIYTSDSSICTAAVHSGLINFQQGGTVTVELRPGRSIYGSTERNGVTSSTYGSWQHSFVFKTPNTESLVRAADEATPVLWNTGAAIVNFEMGKTLKFNCPGGGKEGSVWGTDIYTLDSSICTAAVHAGRIKLDSGGPVTIEMRPGEDSYKGSLRNGIKSNDYEKYGSSFIVK